MVNLRQVVCFYTASACSHVIWCFWLFFLPLPLICVTQGLRRVFFWEELWVIKFNETMTEGAMSEDRV